MAPAAPAGQSLNDQAPDPDADLVDFVTYVFDDVQSFWGQQLGGKYQPADLVLFTQQTQSGCGLADAGMGPFYCPVDMTARLDLDFFRELQSRFGAPGDFAQAYVIAHEMGHHVQNLVGISDKVSQEEQNNPDQANELSVRLELQADCYAGVWGHSVFARGDLDQGDIEEAIGAATAVGDDTLQRQATGTINQDTWTHGSSAERVKWFNTGFQSGTRISATRSARRISAARRRMRFAGWRSTDCRAKREAPPEAKRTRRRMLNGSGGRPRTPLAARR